jgi:hypothetical protein
MHVLLHPGINSVETIIASEYLQVNIHFPYFCRNAARSNDLKYIDERILGSEEPRMAAGLLEGAVLLERRKEMQLLHIARDMPNMQNVADNQM